MLPHRLIKGTQSRCPKGLWESLLQDYRVVVDSEDRNEMMEAVLTKTVDASLEETRARCWPAKSLPQYGYP